MSQTIVDVQITREIPVVTQVGFGVMLFVVEAATVDPATRVKSYANIQEVAVDFDTIDEAYKAAQRYFGQELRASNILIGRKATAESYVEALNEIRDINDDWYALAIESRDPAIVESVSDYIQALPRLFLAASDDANILDGSVTSDIASVLLDKTNWRTAVIYSSTAANNYPEVAWAGGMLPRAPGTATWAFKSLSGISTDQLNSAQRDAARNKRATVYINIAGNNVTSEGQVAEVGNYIDIVRGTDWLAQRMSERIFAQLSSRPKIPYIGGGAVLEQEIRAQLDIAVERNVVAPGFVVDVPLASAQSPNDRGERRYRNITFTATLVGAVHGAQIRGVVTV